MAFKPKREQDFYLIAKDSGLALGIPNGNDGSALTQQAFNPSGGGSQTFQFHYGGPFCWIVVRPFDKYLCRGNGEANKEPVVNATWNPPAWTLRWVMIPDGEGSYFIRSMNNEKYFDVYGAAKTAGNAVVVHTLNSGANQRFIPVPVVNNQKPGPSPISLVQTNEMIRTAALGAIGLIPEIGGGLKFITGVFWKEKDKLAEIWDQMKTYVDIRIQQFMKADKLKTLGGRIQGYLDVIKQIENSTDHFKGPRILAVLDNLTIMQRDYWVDQDSLEVLPYMVGVGSIIINLRRMMYVDYKTLFNPEVDKKTEEEIKREIETNKALLLDAITTYTAQVEKSRRDLIDWRMRLIPDVGYGSHFINNAEPKENEPGSEEEVSGAKGLLKDPHIPVTYFYGATARDNYDGWEQGWKYSVTYGATMREEGDKDYKARGNNAVEQRRNQVRVQFTAEVDELLKPAQTWKYFNPDEKKGPDVTVFKSVGAYGSPYASTRFEGVSDKRITKVVVHAHNGNICGLEVFYGSSDGLKGKTGNESATLDLSNADEHINCVYGFARYNVEALGFTTNKGRLVNAGALVNRDSGNFFNADVQDSFNARLVRISGAYDGGTIQQLTFHWAYVDKILTVPAKKA